MRGKKMNKLMKKLSFALLAVMTTTSILSGCSAKSSSSSSSEAGVSTSKEVKLKMYLLGDKPKDYDAVYGKINELMKKKINATLDVQFISWGDQATKYPLLFSSGDDFDLIFTATGWCYYNQMATRNGFLNLTDDLLKKYAPETFKNEPKVAWDQAKVNGKIYMVPNDQNEYGTSVLAIRGDLREKYGIGEIKSLADLEKYYDAVAKNEKDIAPIINGGGQNLQWPIEVQSNGLAQVTGTGTEPLIAYDMSDTSGKVFSIAGTTQFKDYATKMKQYADKGYWSKSSVSSKETRDDGFKAGKSASMVWNVGSCANDAAIMNKAHPDWKVEVVDINPGKKKYVNLYTNNGVAVNANSKNPERALMALDLLRYNQDIQDLSFYGIKGTHWDAVGTTQYKTLDATANFPAGNVCPWGWHTSITRTDVNQPAIVKQYNDKWVKEDTIHHPLETFTFDDSKVKNEMAAINNVITQYGLPINLGIMPDVDKAVTTYNQKLKDAGMEKVLKEVQDQVNTYIKGH
jgi:putative aldouronate transport system substrate-binding protein